jgi:hypothetical protein
VIDTKVGWDKSNCNCKRRNNYKKQRLAWLEAYIPPIAKYAMDGAPFYFGGAKKTGNYLAFVVACDELYQPALDQGGLGDEDVAGAAAVERAAGQLGYLRVGEVGVFEVLRQHAVGVEEAAVDGDAMLLHA